MSTAKKAISHVDKVFLLNGKGTDEDYEAALNDIKAALDENEQLEAKRKQLEAAIEAKRVAAEVEKQAALDEKREQLIAERATLLLEAESWEKKAALYKMAEDIDNAMAENLRCFARVAELDRELGIVREKPLIDSYEEPLREEMTVWEKALSHTGSLVFAILLFAGLSWFCFYNVELIGNEINAYNKAAQAAGDVSAMLPPSISQMSFQKAWFSWMNIFTSLIGAIAILAVIAPAHLIFILPFTKTPTLKWKHFFEQSEEQKQWQSFGYVAAVLLFLALCHVAVS